MSCSFAPVTTSDNGAPRPSTNSWRLPPFFPDRSNFVRPTLGVVSAPPGFVEIAGFKSDRPGRMSDRQVAGSSLPQLPLAGRIRSVSDRLGLRIGNGVWRRPSPESPAGSRNDNPRAPIGKFSHPIFVSYGTASDENEAVDHKAAVAIAAPTVSTHLLRGQKASSTNVFSLG